MRFIRDDQHIWRSVMLWDERFDCNSVERELNGHALVWRQFNIQQRTAQNKRSQCIFQVTSPENWSKSGLGFGWQADQLTGLLCSAHRRVFEKHSHISLFASINFSQNNWIHNNTDLLYSIYFRFHFEIGPSLLEGSWTELSLCTALNNSLYQTLLFPSAFSTHIIL